MSRANAAACGSPIGADRHPPIPWLEQQPAGENLRRSCWPHGASPGAGDCSQRPRLLLGSTSSPSATDAYIPPEAGGAVQWRGQLSSWVHQLRIASMYVLCECVLPEVHICPLKTQSLADAEPGCSGKQHQEPFDRRELPPDRKGLLRCDGHLPWWSAPVRVRSCTLQPGKPSWHDRWNSDPAPCHAHRRLVRQHVQFGGINAKRIFQCEWERVVFCPGVCLLAYLRQSSSPCLPGRRQPHQTNGHGWAAANS